VYGGGGYWPQTTPEIAPPTNPLATISPIDRRLFSPPVNTLVTWACAWGAGAGRVRVNALRLAVGVCTVPYSSCGRGGYDETKRYIPCLSVGTEVQSKSTC
jgi:hypothetical protein